MSCSNRNSKQKHIAMAHMHMCKLKKLTNNVQLIRTGTLNTLKDKTTTKTQHQP